MKLSDIKYGKKVSGRFLLRGTAKKEWQDKVVELQRIDEETLSFSPPNISNPSTVEIQPYSADAERLLRDIQQGHTGVIGCIMKAAGQQIEINGLAFALPPFAIPVKLQIALSDEFIETVVMKEWRKVKNFRDAITLLESEFCLQQLRYWLVTTGPKDQNFERGFSVLGSSHVLDLAPFGKGELRPQRIVRYKGRNFDERPIYLMREPLDFCDKTVANTMQFAAISALKKVVGETDSWIAGWKRYNEEEDQLLEERFGRLPDLHYQGEPRSHWGDRDNPLLAFNLTASASVSPWLRYITAEGLPVKIYTDVNSTGITGGSVVDYEQRSHRLKLIWSGNQDPPRAGVIRPSMAMEKSRLQKRNEALQIVETATANLPYLGLILEGKPFAQATPYKNKPLTKAVRKMFGGTPTPDQEKALRIALTTPDIALIQGPPGTGKTRVIQALLTMLNEGREPGVALDTVLVTSFQHEAVDNAIAGMNVTGLPVDRIGGKKGEDRGAQMIESWAHQVVKGVQSRISEEPPATLVLIDQLTGYLSHWRTSTGGRDGTREILWQFRNTASTFLSANRIAELDRLAATFPNATPLGKPVIQDSSERDELEKRLNQQCTTAENFLDNDDGVRQARRLRRFLEPYLDNLSADIVEAVEVAASWSAEDVTHPEPWLSLKEACTGILDLLLVTPTATTIPQQEMPDEEIEACLLAAIEEVADARNRSEDGIQEALGLFVRYLNEEPIQVRETIRNYSAIQATSCGQADSKQLGMADRRSFAVVVADEAARANPLDLLIPMVKGRRIILVGDYKQLPHVLEPEIERSLAKQGDEQLQKIYGKSLFERLWATLAKQTSVDGIERTAMLTDQFRMHPTIGKFVSQHFYEGKLTSKFITAQMRPNYIGAYNGKPVAWLDVPADLGGEERTGNRSCLRKAECDRIMDELRRILPTLEEKYPNPDPNQPIGMVGIIAFYSAQEEALLQAIENPRSGLPEHLRRRVRVGTVDAFQGREYDIVYLSTVRSNQYDTIEQRLGFTALPNRLCVAFSRARCLLIGVGDSACVAGKTEDSTPWSPAIKAFVELCQSEGYADIF